MPDLRELFLKDKIFAYPTEGVWGIGCNPFSELAVKRLIQLKNRDENKGIIVLAGNLGQIKALTGHLDSDIRIKMEDKWPGPHTWLIPSASNTPKWLLGNTGLLALRVSDHKTVQNLTSELKMPICSTSANISGNAPAKDEEEIRKFFGDKVHIIEGQLGGLSKPTPVQILETEEWIRK
jgi:L-threonylcarbamoyladenylate synthase